MPDIYNILVVLIGGMMFGVFLIPATRRAIDATLILASILIVVAIISPMWSSSSPPSLSDAFRLTSEAGFSAKYVAAAYACILAALMTTIRKSIERRNYPALTPEKIERRNYPALTPKGVVVRLAQLFFLACIFLWIYTISWGMTLGGFELSALGFFVGAPVGFIMALLFGIFYADLLPGQAGPVKRIMSFSMYALLVGGVVAGSMALVLNRFLPAEPASERVFVLSGLSKISRGWSAMFVDANGNQYEHIFGFRTDFVPVPIGSKYKFLIQTGYFGYPYFHSYERVR